MTRRFIFYCVRRSGKEGWLVDLYLLCAPNGKEEWLVDLYLLCALIMEKGVDRRFHIYCVPLMKKRSSS